MKHSKSLLALFAVTLSSCISTPRVPPAPDVDQCKVTVRGGFIVCRCVKPDETLYSVPIEQCAHERYDAVSPEDGRLLRAYVLQLQTELDQCRREDTK